jgi:hypothetical protein
MPRPWVIQAFGSLLRHPDNPVIKNAYARRHSMSWSSGGSNPSPFAEEPYLTEAERESIGPLAEWVLNMVRSADGAVSHLYNVYNLFRLVRTDMLHPLEYVLGRPPLRTSGPTHSRSSHGRSHRPHPLTPSGHLARYPVRDSCSGQHGVTRQPILSVASFGTIWFAPQQRKEGDPGAWMVP